MKKYIYDDWESAYFCVKCDKQLTWNEIMGSLGTCPYCGNHDHGTVVDHRKSSYRNIYKVEKRTGILGWLGLTKTVFVKKEIKI